MCTCIYVPTAFFNNFFYYFLLQRATLAEKEVTALKEQLTNNKAQDTNVMTMATPLSNLVESTEDQNKTPAELELSAKEKEVRIFERKNIQYYIGRDCSIYPKYI